MDDSTIEKIIENTVNRVVSKLKLAGLMNDSRKTAFQKTEEILRNYNQMKEIYDTETAKKFIDIIGKSLDLIRDDPYFEIIPMVYYEGQTREAIAEYFDTTVTTISRHKTRLINKLKLLIFADDVIHELFL